MEIIPVPDNPHRREKIPVDGVTLFWIFNYEARSESWYIDVLDSDEQPIIRGKRLTPGWNPLMRRKSEALPKGTFYVYSTLDPIGRDGFASGDAQFVYFDEAETAENAATIEEELVLFEVDP
jgi:hypothetical protein